MKLFALALFLALALSAAGADEAAQDAFFEAGREAATIEFRLLLEAESGADAAASRHLLDAASDGAAAAAQQAAANKQAFAEGYKSEQLVYKYFPQFTGKGPYATGQLPTPTGRRLLDAASDGAAAAAQQAAANKQAFAEGYKSEQLVYKYFPQFAGKGPYATGQLPTPTGRRMLDAASDGAAAAAQQATANKQAFAEGYKSEQLVYKYFPQFAGKGPYATGQLPTPSGAGRRLLDAASDGAAAAAQQAAANKQAFAEGYKSEQLVYKYFPQFAGKGPYATGQLPTPSGRKLQETFEDQKVEDVAEGRKLQEASETAEAA